MKPEVFHYLARGGRLRHAHRRLDAGRRDAGRDFPRSAVLDLRTGHPGRPYPQFADGDDDRADGDNDRADGENDHNRNHNNYHNDNNNNPVPPVGPGPVRVQRWLTIGYRETLKELMT